MFVFAIVAVVGLIAGFVLASKRAKPPSVGNKAQSFDENALPVASEGETICVLFGTREIRKSNLVGVGGFHTDEVEIG